MNHFDATLFTQNKAINDLSAKEKSQLKQAMQSAQQGYAPYSGLQVGAVAFLSNGASIPGNNQENASYPCGICAERVAVFSANAQYPHEKIESVALIALKNGTPLPRIAPCGLCRQVLFESERKQGQPIELLLCGKESVQVIPAAAWLLPLAFDANDF